MLRRLNIQVLNNPNNFWPIALSLLLHAVGLMLIALPHAPKVPEFIAVELSSMPQFSAPASALKAASAQHAAAVAPRTEPFQPVAAKNAVEPEPVKQVISAPTAFQKTAPVQAASVTQGSKTSNVAAVAKAGPPLPSDPVESRFGVSDGPAFAHPVQPVYPRIARKLGKEGTVLLRISLDERGALTSVVVVEKAGHGFDEAAVNAVKASRFRAARQRGVSVACRALLPIRFRLEG